MVRRAAESTLGAADGFDAAGAETVAPIADSCAAMSVLPGKVNRRIMRWARAARFSACCVGDESTRKRAE
jgi:hypothetical protein